MKSIHLIAPGFNFLLGYTDRDFQKVSDYLSSGLPSLDMAVDLLLERDLWTLESMRDGETNFAKLMTIPHHLIGMLLINGFDLTITESSSAKVLTNDCSAVRYFMKDSELRLLGEFYFTDKLDEDDSFQDFIRFLAPGGTAKRLHNGILAGASLLSFSDKEKCLMMIDGTGVAIGRTSTLTYFGVRLFAKQ